jgi:hypothetical protein
MRRKQSELVAVLTASRQEPAASLRALLELSMPHMLIGAVLRDHPEVLDSHRTLDLIRQHTARLALRMLESGSS